MNDPSLVSYEPNTAGTTLFLCHDGNFCLPKDMPAESRVSIQDGKKTFEEAMENMTTVTNHYHVFSPSFRQVTYPTNLDPGEKLKRRGLGELPGINTTYLYMR